MPNRNNKKLLSIGCVIMAAGNSERFGSNKLLSIINGKQLIECAFNAIPTDRSSSVCVVTQYPEVRELARQYGYDYVLNDRPEDGISRTVRLGTEFLSEKCDAILYLVSDQPLLKKESVAGLIDYFIDHQDNIIVSSCNGKRGNPCIFPKKYFPELCSLKGDIGGSTVIRSHPESLLLFELTEEELFDIDTADALKNLQ